MDIRINKAAPEARQALNDLRMEISRELAIPMYNSMTSSEYPAYMNDLDDSESLIQDRKMKNNGKIYNHDLY